jgi:hypothetical protein
MCGSNFVPVFQAMPDVMTLNVGAIAGRVAVVMELVTKMTRLFDSRAWIPHPWRKVYPPCDMAAITAAVMCGYDNFDVDPGLRPCLPPWKYYCGAPFVSPFLGEKDRDPYAIIHK